jgi:VanZ like protein
MRKSSSGKWSWLWRWGPVLIQMAVIFGASSIPNVGALPGNISDKTAHFAGYALLSVLALRAWAGGRIAGISWRTALLAIAFASLYGASDEIHQLFVPGRSSDIADVAADVVGACAGAFGGLLVAVVAAWSAERRHAPTTTSAANTEDTKTGTTS